MEESTAAPISPEPNTMAETEGNNLVLDQIMKMKQERLKIIHEFSKEQESEMLPLMKEVQDNFKKKESTPKMKKKTDASTPTPVRRSQRISSRTDEEQPKITETQKVHVERPPNDYGPMPGIQVGHHWETRMECSLDGVHRPTVAGIHAGPLGAYSIALSGGYPEDVDEGHTFTYTGTGGRDLKGTSGKPKNLRIAPQTRDQDLEGANYSLVRSIETGKPVRVIRGFRSESVFAPETGYRYDGLYKVVKYWEDFGKTGFRIYRFKMVRMQNQAPPPWEKLNKKTYSENNENADPNVAKSDEKSNEQEIDSLEVNNSNKNDAVSLDSKTESELDSEIIKCNAKLCENSLSLLSYCEKLKENIPESSFVGWD